jgi:hypothetical protein
VGGEEAEGGELKKRLLRSPMKPRQIRIFSAGGLLAVSFFRLALDAARFLLALLHLLRFFTVAFGERCFGWFSDGALLVGVNCALVYTKAGSPVEGKNSG